jgi:hypothetical protein
MIGILPQHYMGAGIAQWHSAELRAGWLGVRVPAGAVHFSFHHRVQTGSEAPPSLLPSAYQDLFPGREADHLPTSWAEVRNAWIYASDPPVRIHDVVLS